MSYLNLLGELQDEMPTEKTVDTMLINKIINDRYLYQDYFENWKTRLKQAFEKN